MSRNNYTTKQKKYILDFFKNNNSTLYSAKEIMQELENKNINIGLTTIYRCLEQLTNNNDLMIFYGDFGKKHGYFPCINDSHYHIICSSCGHIEHLDCNYFNDLKKHLIQTHNFHLNRNEIFLKGRCTKCL